MKSTLKNMVLVLMLITFFASSAVGFVYQLTAAPIAAANEAKTTNAIADVLPEFKELLTPKVIKVDGGELRIHEAKDGDKLVGYAVETFTKEGFSGDIKLMVGFKADMTINNIAVISHNETPGLGDKIQPSKSDFSVQFQGKDPETFKLSIKKEGGDVDAITASTITTAAYCDAVKRAYRAVAKQE